MLSEKMIEKLCEQSYANLNPSRTRLVHVDPVAFAHLVEAATWDAAVRDAQQRGDKEDVIAYRARAQACRRAAKEKR